MQIKQYDYQREYEQYAEEYERKAIQILRSGWYTLGEELNSFESEWAEYTGTQYCVGCACGLDALWISIKLLGIGKGDEVIVQANTYIASVMSITMNDATPIFVEPDVFFGINAEKIEEKISSRTKAIMVVHLYGMPCDMDNIVRLCNKYNLKLIEDCAQSHGSTYKGRTTGSFGDVGCFSFFPSKTLGAYGDGGCIITNDKQLADHFLRYRNYGSDQRYHFKEVGVNSRLDSIQAGLLRVKLSHLNEIIEERSFLVNKYFNGLRNELISLPKVRESVMCSWHQFVIRCHCRDQLMRFLESEGIGTYVHYPIPPHLSEAYHYMNYCKGAFPITESYSDTVLSLPLFIGMTEEEQDYIIEKINAFNI